MFAERGEKRWHGVETLVVDAQAGAGVTGLVERQGGSSGRGGLGSQRDDNRGNRSRQRAGGIASVGPLWMSHEVGKLVGQFRSFGFAAVQRILLSGLQQSTSKNL